MNANNEKCFGERLESGISCLLCPGVNEAGTGFSAISNIAFFEQALKKESTVKIPKVCLPRLKQSQRWREVIDYSKSDE